MYIYVLIDDRAGSSNQAISLAESLALKSCKINLISIKLVYNFFAYFPNFILSNFALHIKNKKILDFKIKPDIIISSGRRTGLVSLYLKKKYKCTVVHIMKPPCNKDQFDIIILSRHDCLNRKWVYHNNVYIIDGVLNSISPIYLAPKAEEFKKIYPSLYNNFIGILIGGNTKYYKFSNIVGRNFLNIILRIMKLLNLTVFISFSRRTPTHIKKLFKYNLPVPNIIYDPLESVMHNPYLDILSSAKFLIVTCDSISMCSECAASGKPLYIYKPLNFTFNKNLYLIKYLELNNSARLLTNDITNLVYFTPNPLSNIEATSKYLMNFIKDKYNID